MNSIEKIRQELFDLLRSEAYFEGRFTLSSGKQSDFYLDCRRVTLSSQGVYLCSLLILNLIKQDQDIVAVGGPTIGADPLVGAITVLSLINHIRPLKSFLVRKSAKEHGLQRQIEGPVLDAGSHVVLIDDVATTGNSLIDCINVLKDKEIIVDKVIVIVDREEGARDKLEAIGCPFYSIFSIRDFRK